MSAIAELPAGPVETSDVDGSIDSPGDVRIAGSVRAGAIIHSNAHVVIGGDITGALITCAGEVQAAAGAVVGGIIIAGGGITCRVAGDEAHTPTELRIGFDEPYLDSVDRRLKEIQTALAQAEAFHERLKPLLQTQKSLTADQKERVSEHLYRAMAVKKRVLTAIQQLTQKLNDRVDRPVECNVTSMIYPGVRLAFPGITYPISEPLEGPVRLSATRGAKVVGIHLTHVRTGKSHFVEAAVEPGRFEALQTALATLAEVASR